MSSSADFWPCRQRRRQLQLIGLTRHLSLVTFHSLLRAISSVVEHLLHTQGVAGSIPASRTILFPNVFSSAELVNRRSPRRAPLQHFELLMRPSEGRGGKLWPFAKDRKSTRLNSSHTV